ncbi:MAG: WD40 repeat domain-containing protein [Acidobacteria bacterium]|nr:WD40 repeat domain-containing protein [Acidobacteriota bacterium]
MNLASFGLSSRTLEIWKATGARPSVQFKVLSFSKPAWEKNSPAFEMDALDFFARSSRSGGDAEGLLRPNGKTLEMSRDNGSTWTAGERHGDAWEFAFDTDFITLEPMDQDFVPSRFSVKAYERGALVKTSSNSAVHAQYCPRFSSMVLALAEGKNECEGIIKFPGSSFEVQLKGVLYGDRWIVRSLEPLKNLKIDVRNYDIGPAGDAGAHEHGARYEDGTFPQYLQVDINAERTLMGAGEFIDYGQTGDISEQLEAANAYEASSAKELPDLAQAYAANFGHAVWTRSDEDQSFSREAEKAFVKAGCTAWFWAPYTSNGIAYGDVTSQDAQAKFGALAGRVKSIGGTVGLLAPGGHPAGQSASVNQPYAHRSNEDRIPIIVLHAPGQWITVTSPNEVAFWSDDMKVIRSKGSLSPMEGVSGGGMSPDGRQFATSGTNGARLWDTTSDSPRMTLPVDGCPLTWCVSFAPDGGSVAVGGNDGRTRIYDARTGRLLGATKQSFWGRTIKFGDGDFDDAYVACLSTSYDGQLLAEGMSDGKVRIWSLANKSEPKKVKFIDTDLQKIWKVYFLRNGALLAMNRTGSIRLFESERWKVTNKADSVSSTAISAQLTADESGLVTEHLGGMVDILDLATGSIHKEISVDGANMGALASQEGRWMLFTGDGFKAVNL